MRWVERQPELALAPDAQIALLDRAIAARPDNPQLHAKLGAALLAGRKPRDAVAAFERALTLDAQTFGDWALLAQAHLDSGQAEAALAVCSRGEAQSPSAAVRYCRALALRKLDRRAESDAALHQAAQLGSIGALKRLLKALAVERGGGALLALCDSQAANGKSATLVRAYRVIALSRLGRDAEANALVDLERHVARVPLAPCFGDALDINRQLEEETLADRTPSPVTREDFAINYSPRFERSRAFLALRAFMSDAIERFIGEFPARGLDRVMPPPPDAGMLGGATVVLRGPARNGQHIHSDAYVSAVYYAAVPLSVQSASDRRGALELGRCDNHTGGYMPCWGTRYLKPEPGMLVLFPSHIFHDVVPSLTDEPRISIAADLKPRD